MNKRERILAIVFGGVIVAGVALRFGNFSDLRAVFDYGPQIREARQRLEETESEQGELEDSLTRQYHDYVLRTGGTDPSDVFDDFYDRLINLQRRVSLRDWSTNPKDPSINSKTKIATIRCSVNATGPYGECIKFMQEVYKLPYLARFKSLTLSPVTVSQKPYEDKVKFDGEIEILVLPEEELLGVPRGPQPEDHVSYALADFTALRNWKPFIPYQPPAPPPPPPPVVPPKPTVPDKPIVRVPQEPVDPDAADTVLRMVLGYGVKEVLLRNTASGSSFYAGMGELLDGGTIVLIHALGAVVHKEAEDTDFGYFVYPIGEPLDTRVALTDAVEWPEIQYAMQRYFDAQPRDVDTNGLGTNGLDTNGLGADTGSNAIAEAATSATARPVMNTASRNPRPTRARTANTPLGIPTGGPQSGIDEDFVGPPVELAGPVDKRLPAKVANSQRSRTRRPRPTSATTAVPPDATTHATADATSNGSEDATTNATQDVNSRVGRTRRPATEPKPARPGSEGSSQPSEPSRVNNKVPTRRPTAANPVRPMPGRSQRQPPRAVRPNADTPPVADEAEVAEGTAEDDPPTEE